MDKFDESIRRAKQDYKPTNNFVEVTMQAITNRQPNKRFSMKLWIPILAGGLAVIALLFIVLPLDGRNTASKKASDSQSVAMQNPQTHPAQSSSATTPAAGSDNARLASDLSGINGATNQENSDQSSASSAINDSQQQISVPTN